VKLRERDIQRLVTDWLQASGYFWYRNNVGAMSGSHKGKRWFVRFGYPGLPDVVVIVSGVYVGLEFKQPGKQLSAAQVDCSLRIKNAGGEYARVQSLEDAQLVIENVLARLKEAAPCGC
jgi:hypothetical protein